MLRGAGSHPPLARHCGDEIEGRVHGHWDLNPNQLGDERPPVCEETEGRLCQIENEGAGSTSGFTQVESSNKVEPLT